MSAASSPARQERPQGITLLQAVEAGDLGSVEVLIAAGVDVNSTTDRGMTALMSAAANGHLGLVSLLLERGADINTKRYDGFDALALAVFFGHLHVVRELLSRGADLKAKNRFGSPEMWATARGFPDIAQILNDAKTTNPRDTLACQSDESNAPSPERTGAQELILGKSFFSEEELSDETLSHATETSPIPVQIRDDSSEEYEWIISSTNSSELTTESPASVWTTPDDPLKEHQIQQRNRGTIGESMTAEVKHNAADIFAPVITQQTRALPVEKQPSLGYSTYVAKPRYHHKRKSRKLVRCLAYLTSDWQRLTVVTLIVMLISGLGTFAFLKLLSLSKPPPTAKPANVAEPSASELQHFNAQNDLDSPTRAEKIPYKRAIYDASGQQALESAKRNDAGIGPHAERIEHPSTLRIAERPVRKSAERGTGARPNQAMTPKRETQAVSRSAPSLRSDRVSAKGIPSRSAGDLTLEDNSAKALPHAPRAPLSIEMRRPRSVTTRNDSPPPAGTAGRNTKPKVIQWP